MPRGDYTSKLTTGEILTLIREGRYHVDLDLGEVTSGRTQKRLFTYTGSARSKTPYVSLYKSPKFISIPVSRLIWIAATEEEIPEGFQIHHLNKDDNDNRWENLVALHSKDHFKFHTNGHSEEEVPF